MFSKITVIGFKEDGKRHVKTAPHVLVRIKRGNRLVTLCKGLYSFKNETFYAYDLKEQDKDLLLQILAERDWDRRVKCSYSAKILPHHFPVLLKGPADKTAR